jgi:hypothetical protein
MPLRPDDRLVPGSERACEVVDDQAMAAIVRDLRNGPSQLPLASGTSPSGRGWQEAQSLADWKPPGDRYVTMLLDDADRRDREAKVAAEVERLKAEIARLKAEMAKAEAKP